MTCAEQGIIDEREAFINATFASPKKAAARKY